MNLKIRTEIVKKVLNSKEFFNDVTTTYNLFRNECPEAESLRDFGWCAGTIVYLENDVEGDYISVHLDEDDAIILDTSWKIVTLYDSNETEEATSSEVAKMLYDEVKDACTSF
jgi:hypothetical protein